MPTEILMPALSPTMEEGNLAKWVKAVGDEVAPGDVIAEIETDKATMEVEAVDEGQLGKILVEAGTEGVKVNTPIAILLAEGEDDSALESAGTGGSERAAPASAAEDTSATRRTDERQGRRQAGRRRGCERHLGAAGSGRGQDASRSRRRHRRLRAGGAGGHRDGVDDRARGTPRCHGRGDAPRRKGLRHWRGGRRIPGRLQDHARAAGRVRRAARRRHADHRARLCRPRRRRRLRRPQADRRVHDLQLRHAGDRPDHQFGGQDPLHGWRPDGLPDRVPRPERRCGARRRPAQPGLRLLVQPCAGPEGRAAVLRLPMPRGC